MPNKTTFTLLLLVLLLNQITSIKRGELLEEHLSDEQLEELEKEVKRQEKMEIEVLKPQKITYDGFAALIYNTPKPTKAQLKILDQESI
jgi:hypothetical protein